MPKRDLPESPEVTLARLKNVLDYNPKTGVFVWRVRRNSHAGKIFIGAVAGAIAPDKDGGSHIVIGVDGARYRAHNLAWLFMTGAWPANEVDHKDGIRTNNKWKNLRDVNHMQNCWNINKLRAANVSGKTGVTWVAKRNKWMSRLKADGKIIHFGMFDKDKLAEAIAARVAGEVKYYGKFAPSVAVKSQVDLLSLVDARPLQKLNPRNVSGKTGVTWLGHERKWRSSIKVSDATFQLGVFPEDHLDDAIAARKAGELKHLGKYSPT